MKLMNILILSGLGAIAYLIYHNRREIQTNLNDKIQLLLDENSDFNQWRKRELHQYLQTQLVKLNNSVDDLSRQAVNAGSDLRHQLDTKREELEGVRRDTEEKLRVLKSLTSEAWEDFKGGMKDYQARMKEALTNSSHQGITAS